MPLLKKKPFPLDEPPEDLEPNELVFQVRFTKEIYRDYHDYLNRINFYRQRIWMCKVTAKTNLTYEEALVSEKLATEKVLQFPKELVAPALRIIQYSTFSLKDLADAMAETLHNQLFVGTELYATRDGKVVPCKILEIIRGVNKVHYEVGWLDEKKKIMAKSEVSRAALIQKKPRLSRNILKSFIRQSTYRNAPWVITNELARNHGISTDIPEVLRGTIFFKNGLICTKKRNYQEFKDEDENQFQKKSRKGERKGCSIEEETCHSEEEPTKYPIDDLLVKPGPYDSVLAERPSPCRDFSVPMDCVGDLLMVWDFCSSFCKLLHLWPFSIEVFENAICHKDGNVVLLVECHTALFRLLIEDNGKYFLCCQKKRRQKLKITMINWTDYLCDFLEMIKLPELCPYESTIKRGHYSLVDTQGKLGILRELVNQALETATIREKLDEFIQQRQELGASKRGEALEDGKKRRQEKEQLKADSDSNNNSKQKVSTTNGNEGMDAAREESLTEESGRNNSKAMTKGKSKKRGDVKLLSENGKESSLKESQHHAESDQGTVGKTNVEERREYYEREMEKRFIRTNPLGKDRHYNRYWWFRRDGRIFVESSDSKEWGYYISMEELDQLMASLNCKGVRERELWRQLKRYYNRMRSELQKRSKDSTHQLALDEGILRRSTRVRAPPRENPSSAFLRYVNKWKED